MPILSRLMQAMREGVTANDLARASHRRRRGGATGRGRCSGDEGEEDSMFESLDNSWTEESEEGSGAADTPRSQPQ